MCGIAGIISKDSPTLGNDLINMLNELIHRGKDATGVAIYENRDTIDLRVSMTDASYHGGWDHSQTARDVELPAPQPFGAPVLIGDCATPLGGETVLALLLRRLDHPKEEGRDMRGPR